MTEPRHNEPNLRPERWTTTELVLLQAELMSRHLLDPIYKQCSDAIGSLMMDKVDLFSQLHGGDSPC